MRSAWSTGVAEVHPVIQTMAEAAEFTTNLGRIRKIRDAIFADQPRLCVPLPAMLADTPGLFR